MIKSIRKDSRIIKKKYYESFKYRKKLFEVCDNFSDCLIEEHLRNGFVIE